MPLMARVILALNRSRQNAISNIEDTTMWYVQSYLSPIETVVNIIIRHSYHRII